MGQTVCIQDVYYCLILYISHIYIKLTELSRNYYSCLRKFKKYDNYVRIEYAIQIILNNFTVYIILYKSSKTFWSPYLALEWHCGIWIMSILPMISRRNLITELYIISVPTLQTCLSLDWKVCKVSVIPNWQRLISIRWSVALTTTWSWN